MIIDDHIFLPVDAVVTVLALTKRCTDGGVIIEVGGEIDCVTAPQLTDFVDVVVRTETPGRLTLRLADVTFFGAAGLHALEHIKQLMAEYHGSIALTDLSSTVLRVLTISGELDRYHVQSGDAAPPPPVRTSVRSSASPPATPDLSHGDGYASWRPWGRHDTAEPDGAS